MFSRFILGSMQWLTLFNATRCLLSLDKALVGEDFKVAWGGKKKNKGLFSLKEDQLASTNQKDFCSLRLKIPGESLAGRTSPPGESIPPSSPSTCWLRVKMQSVDTDSIHIAASPGSKPTQTLPSCGKVPRSSAPRMQALASPAVGNRGAKAPGKQASGGCPPSKPRPHPPCG